jgi:hypothetical protein
MDRLRGKDISCYAKGTRSSRVPSSIFNQLRKLDRQISKLKNQLRYVFEPTYKEKLIKKIHSLDLKRKEVRNKRKYYARNQRL